MSEYITRRETVRRGLAAASLLALVPDWAIPAIAQGETLVPFTDLPANFNPTPSPERRTLDIRKIDGPFTPADQFFTTQHLGHPVIDPATFALKVSGLVERPKSFSLDELRKMRSTGTRVRFRMLRQSASPARSREQRTLDRRPSEGRARSGRREARGARVRLLRRRSR